MPNDDSPGMDPLATLERVEGSVFHYTSADGLLGILEGQALWASEAASLNDIAEIRQGWEHVRAWLAEHPGDMSDRLGDMAEDVPFSMKEAYLLSASTAGDDANQWRLYGGQVRGYAIELDASVPLAVVVEGKRPTHDTTKTGTRQIGQLLRYSVGVSPWFKCLYTDADKDRALDHAITVAAAEKSRIASAQYDEETYFEMIDDLRYSAMDNLFTIASLIKSEGFSGEQEARVVVTPLTRETYERFRASEVGIVSYVALGTAQGHGRFATRVYRKSGEVAPLPLEGVTAGPLLRPESHATVEALLKRSGNSRAVVRPSAVPLR